MEPSEALEPRDDVSSIASFELVRTSSRTKDDWAETTTIAASELTLTEDLVSPFPTTSQLPTPPRLRLWRDIVRPWLSYGRAVFTDSFFPEVAALAFSFGCLVETTITLRFYSGYPLSRLPLGLTLNALLALLAAGSKSSLIFAVAATMSQCKWCWLRTGPEQRRHLHHLQVVDEASRGPLGSLSLLLRHTMTSLLYLGAVITVLSLAFEPFIQQVVSYPVMRWNTTSSQATATRAIGIDPSAISGSMSLQNYVLAGILAGMYGSSFPDHTWSCSTGNCTFDPFWSVDWCSKCTPAQLVPQTCTLETADFQMLIDEKNITKTCDFAFSDPNVTANQFNVTFGGAYGSLSLDYPLIWPLSVGAYNDTNTAEIIDYFNISQTEPHRFLNETNPLLALGYAAPVSRPEQINTTIPSSIDAHVCILSPCSRKYNVSISNGILVKEPLEEDYGTIFVNEWDGSVCWRPKNSTVTDDEYDTTRGSFDLEDRIWCGIDVKWIESILACFDGMYSTTWANSSTNAMWVNSTWRAAPIPHTNNYILDNVLSRAKYDPDVFMPNISDALTYLNLQGDKTNSEYLEAFPGTAFIDITFVVVRWAWLSLPFALNLSGLVFVIVVAVYSKRHRVPLWKSSAFALLYHGLDDELLDEDRLYKKASDMEREATTTYVRLAPSDSGRKRLRLRT